MSNRIMGQCWPLKMPPTAKAVLISLADHAGDDGQCWPSIDTICDRTCFGRDAVIDGIVWLEGAGAVAANRENGRKTTYCVTPLNFNPEYFKPSRRATTRDQSSRAEPPEPVGQNHRNQSGRTTASDAQPVGQNHPPGKTDDQSGKTTDQSGKTVKPVGQNDTNHHEPSLNHQGTINARQKFDAEVLDGFVAFWSVYPRKVNKPEASKAWHRLSPDALLQAEILCAVGRQRKQPDWTKDDRKFVPHPATYLNGRRWEDEIPGKAAPVGQVDWVKAAGFTHIAEAQNARCHIGNYREFANGKRIVEEATA